METHTLYAMAYLADLIIGDPEGLPHPVRLTGRLIHYLERLLLGKGGRRMERAKGALLFFLATGSTSAFSFTVLHLASKMDIIPHDILWLYMAYTTIAAKDLWHKGMAVLKALENNSIFEARKRLSLIVGRDTEMLPEEKIVSATMESISENTCDGIVAPMFYLIIGGPVLSVLYKTINTLDSMVGYKNERYIDFGWFSARMDDLANFIPARITGVMILAASYLMRRDWKGGFKIMLRDGRKHPSPNSGIPEAAMAGALGVMLGGPSVYGGKLIPKEYMGDGRLPLTRERIRDALNLSMVSSLLFFIIGWVTTIWLY